MTIFVEGRHTGEHLVSEANGYRSRETVTMGQFGLIEAGAVLGQVLTGAETATATADAGNTGDGTISAVVSANAAAGTHVVTIIEPETDLGTFTVENPAGVTLGSGEVGTEFSGGGLTFTISDGATDFASGDRFEIEVEKEPGSGHFKPYDPSADDGTERAAGISYSNYQTTDAAVRGVATVRQAEVKREALVFLEGVDAAAQAAALADLEVRGIIAR